MKIASLLLALWLPVAACAEDLYSKPVSSEQLAQLFAGRFQSLQQAQAMSGNFVQKKKLSGITRPLSSTGDFLFVRGRGIRWHTLSPFDSDFVLTAKQMVVKESGSVAMRLQTAEQPGLRLVSDIFLAMFALDFKALGTHFSLYVADGKSWQIGLAPQDASLKTVATRITLAGSDRVDQVLLEDAHGDRTEIVLSQVQNLKSVTPAELERFGP